MFEGFTLDRIDTGEAILTVRHGGSGSAVLLLHGHPRTHATWHRVAPLLARYYSVVCPDLRGYGTSSKPPTTPDHAPYSKRVMAGDVLAVMRVLAYDRFAVVGHDRGAYVAFRLPWIIPLRSATWRSSTPCRSGRRWPAATRTSPSTGGIGSSWAKRPSRPSG